MRRSTESVGSGLLENAFAFFQRAKDISESELSFSLVHFCTGLELLFKYRLMQEHWSLISQKTTSKEKFRSGDFQSVDFESAVERLQKIAGVQISDAALKRLQAVRRDRNKIVHFVHQALSANSTDGEERASHVRERLFLGFHETQNLIFEWSKTDPDLQKWSEVLSRTVSTFDGYLRLRYQHIVESRLSSSLRSHTAVRCPICKYETATVEYIRGAICDLSCEVCTARFSAYKISCGGEDCEQEFFFNSYDHFSPVNCSACSFYIEWDFVALQLQYEAGEVGCLYCENFDTAVDHIGIFVCVECARHSTHDEACFICDKRWIGFDEDGDMFGCPSCSQA